MIRKLRLSCREWMPRRCSGGPSNPVRRVSHPLPISQRPTMTLITSGTHRWARCRQVSGSLPIRSHHPCMAKNRSRFPPAVIFKTPLPLVVRRLPRKWSIRALYRWWISPHLTRARNRKRNLLSLQVGSNSSHWPGNMRGLAFRVPWCSLTSALLIRVHWINSDSIWLRVTHRRDLLPILLTPMLSRLWIL